jgi:hypothetical protein
MNVTNVVITTNHKPMGFSFRLMTGAISWRGPRTKSQTNGPMFGSRARGHSLRM